MKCPLCEQDFLSSKSMVVCDKCCNKLENTDYISLVLDDSQTTTFGLIRFANSAFDTDAPPGEIIGQWTKSPIDDKIYVYLVRPIDVLIDKSLVLVKARNEHLKNVTRPVGAIIVSSSVDTKKREEETTSNFSSLRDKLRRRP